MAAMDGLQYHWLADGSVNLLEEWIRFSDQIFPASEWEGLTDPSEYDAATGCLLPHTLHGADA